MPNTRSTMHVLNKNIACMLEASMHGSSVMPCDIALLRNHQIFQLVGSVIVYNNWAWNTDVDKIISECNISRKPQHKMHMVTVFRELYKNFGRHDSLFQLFSRRRKGGK